jgi:hypothetical protein
LANFITRNDVEEGNSPPYSEDAVMDSKKEMTNLEDTTPNYTTIYNEFQQIKPPTNGTQLNSICQEKGLAMHLKLATTTEPNKRN